MEIKLDKNNFNKHTDEGMELLKKSIDEVGAIESICIDKYGEVVTGNARKEAFDDAGFTPKVVELADKEYLVIKTDLDGEKRVKAAILANTVGKKNVELDEKKIREICAEYQIDYVELGVKEYKLPYNYEEVTEVKDEKLTYPITILQTEDEAEMFYKIKEKIGKNEKQTFKKIMQFYYNEKILK